VIEAVVLGSDKDFDGARAAAATAAATITAANLGLDLHRKLLCFDVAVENDCCVTARGRPCTITTRSSQIQITEPQLRAPPRTLVLIFIVISSACKVILNREPRRPE
jgi:hypothetical protein